MFMFVCEYLILKCKHIVTHKEAFAKTYTEAGEEMKMKKKRKKAQKFSEGDTASSGHGDSTYAAVAKRTKPNHA